MFCGRRRQAHLRRSQQTGSPRHPVQDTEGSAAAADTSLAPALLVAQNYRNDPAHASSARGNSSTSLQSPPAALAETTIAEAAYANTQSDDSSVQCIGSGRPPVKSEIVGRGKRGKQKVPYFTAHDLDFRGETSLFVLRTIGEPSDGPYLIRGRFAKLYCQDLPSCVYVSCGTCKK
jgi:hypothetical protein